ncbi:hypothetical protein GCM10010269_64970 [Streptomyces humidus]|uniref:Uncharacterized protein n=1 Tax=Streptomyces humidus TaxID=52259 RepID=A0A918G3N6_9ACTN|nr:hypothetical protein GCM10010269_64970 [Streptomyces humidus]
MEQRVPFRRVRLVGHFPVQQVRDARCVKSGGQVPARRVLDRGFNQLRDRSQGERGLEFVPSRTEYQELAVDGLAVQVVKEARLARTRCAFDRQDSAGSAAQIVEFSLDRGYFSLSFEKFGARSVKNIGYHGQCFPVSPGREHFTAMNA